MHRAVLIAATVAAAVVALPPAATAHNAGCVLLPSGDYVFVGSNKSSPAVGPGAPQTPAGTLDLIPGPGDQYGARFAADQGNSAVVRPFVCTPDGPRAGFQP